MVDSQEYVEIKEDMDLQERLVLEQKYRVLGWTIGANDALDGKASSVMQAGSLIAALVGVFGTGVLNVAPSASDKWWLGFSLLTYITVIGLTVFTRYPRDFILPGPDSWDRMKEGYLLVNGQEAYNKALWDLLSAINKNLKLSHDKARMINLSGVALIVQVTFLAIAVFTP